MTTKMNESNSITYELNVDHVKGFCRLLVNGHECMARTTAWGLCATHYKKFKRNNNGDLEKYGKRIKDNS